MTRKTRGAVFGAMLPLAGAFAAERPKNIVLILADDLRWGDSSCCGATAAALTGQALAHEDAPDSFDISAALLDPPSAGRTTFIAQDPLLSVRDGAWKSVPSNGRKDGPKRADTGLLRDPDTFIKGGSDTGSWNVAQMYNLEADPRETDNLAGKEPARVAAMQAFLQKARADGRTRGADGGHATGR